VQQGGLYALNEPPFWVHEIIPAESQKKSTSERSGLFCSWTNQACLREVMNEKDRALYNKVDFMLGMSPNLGSCSNPSGITKEVHFGTKRAFLFMDEPSLLAWGNEWKRPGLVQQGGLYAWNEPPFWVHEVIPAESQKKSTSVRSGLFCFLRMKLASMRKK